MPDYLTVYEGSYFTTHHQAGDTVTVSSNTNNIHNRLKHLISLQLNGKVQYHGQQRANPEPLTSTVRYCCS